MITFLIQMPFKIDCNRKCMNNVFGSKNNYFRRIYVLSIGFLQNWANANGG